MDIHFTIAHSVDYVPVDDIANGYVVTGGNLAMLLSGEGDVRKAVNDATNVLLDYLTGVGVRSTLAYLTRRGAVVSVAAEPETRPPARRLSVTSSRELALV